MSDRQRGAMYASAAGRGKLGIPRKVARKFIREDREAKMKPGLRAARMGKKQ